MKMTKDQMTFEFLSECFLLDEKTGVLVWRERPQAHFSSRSAMSFFNSHTAGEEAGTIADFRGYKKLVLQVCGVKIPNHRVVYALAKRLDLSEVPEIVDHEDGDSLRNVPSNLRAANHQQSTFNRGMNRNNTSGYKGVVFDPRSSAWVAKIKIDRKTKSLGYFPTREAAAAAYNAAAINAHGEFYRDTLQPAGAAA